MWNTMTLLMYGLLTQLLLLRCVTGINQTVGRWNVKDGGHLRYAKEDLTYFKEYRDISMLSLDIPPECDADNLGPESKPRKNRKRGKRGGIRRRVRARGNKPSLPTMILSNVRSIKNKMSELEACTRFMYEYRESCLLCFIETWLNDSVDEQSISLPGFGSPIRLDRQSDSTGKSIGGGVCIYINKRWCNNVVVRNQECNSDIELLSISVRPTYLPREFGQIFIVLVYIPPSANTNNASELIHENIQKIESMSPSSPKFILGDFKGCTLKRTMPHYSQYVKCPTRNSRTIDLCYGNIKNAYKCYCKPPIGNSDHNAVYLLPEYKQVLKANAVVSKTVKVWNKASLDALQGSFACTDWSELCGECEDPNELCDIITSYISFNVDNLIPQKEIRIYPNNKPWVTKELKCLLNEKKRVFASNDKVKLRGVQKEIDNKVRECKQQIREKVESDFRQSKTRQGWEGLRTMMNCTKTRDGVSVSNEIGFVNDLNDFYARIDCHDFSESINSLLSNMEDSQEETVIGEDEVLLNFLHVKTRKATGPDGIHGIILKHCARELCQVFTRLFNISLRSHVVPLLWKVSEIIPVPKRKNPNSAL